MPKISPIPSLILFLWYITKIYLQIIGRCAVWVSKKLDSYLLQTLYFVLGHYLDVGCEIWPILKSGYDLVMYGGDCVRKRMKDALWCTGIKDIQILFDE